jgi:hypothetical protein
LDDVGGTLKISVPSGGSYVDPDEIEGIFAVGVTSLPTITLGAEFNGAVMRSLTDDGSSGTVTVLINGSAPVLPQTLATGDTVTASRTDDTGQGFFKLSSLTSP